jgi:hypothetical protein
MRKSLWITLTVLEVAIGATVARADSLSTLNFDTAFGEAPTSGMIDCDSAGCPNSIAATIIWEGLTFNFSDSALTSGLQPDISAIYPSCNAAGSSPALAYQTLSGCSGVDGWDTVDTGGTWILSLDSGTPGNFAEATGVGTPDDGISASEGSFTDSTPAPEPGAGALVLTGIVLIGVMSIQKRIAQDCDHATRS